MLRYAPFLSAVLLLSACAPVALRSDDPRRAVVLAPYQRAIGINALNVSEGQVLYASLVDGREAWCSTGPVFFALGEARPACFADPRGGSMPEGWLKTAYIAGTLRSLWYDVDIPYRVVVGPALPPRN